MPFIVRHKSTRPATIEQAYPGATVIDVTSKGPDPWVRFSPFFAHGGIPVPFSDGVTAASVESIWQGLKVFESTGIDPAIFAHTRMRGLKRTVRRFGRCLGHQKGVNSLERLSYLDARWRIYLPSYAHVLTHHLAAEVAELRALGAEKTVVLLDYGANGDLANLAKPLSHAALLARWLDDDWPAQPA